jgi:hypothetical protein
VEKADKTGKTPPVAPAEVQEDLGGRGSTPERSGAQRWCSKDKHSNSPVADLAVSGCGRTATAPAAAAQNACSEAGSLPSRTPATRSNASSSALDATDGSPAGSRAELVETYLPDA